MTHIMNGTKMKYALIFILALSTSISHPAAETETQNAGVSPRRQRVDCPAHKNPEQRFYRSKGDDRRGYEALETVAYYQNAQLENKQAPVHD
jgi:hypothetical protein